LDLNKRPYLQEITDYTYKINGKIFFAKVLKFDRGYKQ
jgi:hypothetical protein